jgi:predicted nuclease of predicted toxin-antitoxin system
MKLLVDAQLPGTLARWLRGRDCDALHLLECGMAQADDASIWRKAGEEGRILVTKDEDFFILATRPGEAGRLLWLRMGNCRTQDLITRLNRDWIAIETAFSEGQRIVELR